MKRWRASLSLGGVAGWGVYAAMLMAFVGAADPMARCAETLQAGSAAADLTPPVGYRMSGYFNERTSTGIHDRLWAKAVYFRQGDTQAALVFCDLIGMDVNVTAAARREAGQATGIPVENIVVAATHSHTGPLYFGALREHFHKIAVDRLGHDPCEMVNYPQVLTAKIAQAVQDAKAAARPVTLRAGSAEQAGLSFNRRFHMKDGSVRFNPGKLNPDIVRKAGPIDPEVGLLTAAEGEVAHPLWSITVFAMHLDTVAGTEYAADYPFHLEESLRKRFGDGFLSVFATGTCGDINHVDVRNDRPQKGHEEAARIGQALADTIGPAMDGLAVVDRPSLAVAGRTVDVPLQQYPPERIAWAREAIFQVGSRELSFLEQVEATKICGLLNRGGTTIPLEVQVFRLGPELALVGLPGEVFVDLGLAIKDGSPFDHTFVFELANDCPCYIPTRKAFAEGSYETVNSFVQPGGGEKLVETALELLHSLDR